jgi:flagellar assembly protein FliH
MLCRIADDDHPVKNIAWQSLNGGPSARAVLPASQALFKPQQPAHDPAELAHRLAELERNHQAELARAHEAAFQEGARQGREQSAAEAKAAADRFGQMLRDLAGLKRKIRNEAEFDVLKLSLAIARRILHRELAVDAEAIQGLIHAALEKLANREISRVRVYPAGVDAVRSALERINTAPAIEICSDPTLKNGDLIFETTLGELDASIDTQLQEIQRGFADRLSLR